MSEVFEGIVSKSRSHDVPSLGSAEQLVLGHEDLEGGGVVYRTGARISLQFSDAMEQLAANMCSREGLVVLVRYDSRLGHRSSIVFRVDGSVERFGPQDEMFVPLDDQGLPMNDVAPLSLDALDPDEEYETAINAIELGLRQLGGPSWRTLHEFISRS